MSKKIVIREFTMRVCQDGTVRIDRSSIAADEFDPHCNVFDKLVGIEIDRRCGVPVSFVGDAP